MQTYFSNQDRKFGPVPLRNTINPQDACVVMLKKNHHIDLWESCASALSRVMKKNPSYDNFGYIKVILS